MMATLQWRKLRKLLLDALLDVELQITHELELDDVNTLLSFVAEHWGHDAPRQLEYHDLEMRMRKLQAEHEKLKEYCRDR